MDNRKQICNVLRQLNEPDYDNLFEKIYPFTTENINGYIDMFDLKDKSLLTVGSSSDQVLNAFYNGCTDITLVDINPYIEEFYELKKAAILKLSYNDFFKFLSFQGNFFKNSKPFNKKTFFKVINKIENNDIKIFGI